MRADQVLSHDTMRVCLRRFGSATSTTMYAALLRIAGEERITVPELLRREAIRLAARPSVTDWLARTGRRPSTIATREVVATLDEWRGEWPDAGR